MLKDRKFAFMLVSILLCISLQANAQDSTSIYHKALNFPDKLFRKVSAKSSNINQKLSAKTCKYLERLAKEERKLKNKLAKKDSLAASKIFTDAQAQYALLQSRIKNPSIISATLQRKYIPHFDTLNTAFSFLERSEGLLNSSLHNQSRLKEAIGKMEVLQQKFNQAEEVKKFIQQRRQFLTVQLRKHGMHLQKFQKQVYYYQAQVDEYKTMFDNPSKIESKALAMLRKSAVFKDFFSKHSQLAALFRLPENSSEASTASQPGLQTTESIRNELTKHFGSGANVQQILQQQVQETQLPLSQLKENVNKLKEGRWGNGDPQMPDFKPNQQKTKRFMNRLELGTNMQTVKTNQFFPVTSDIGVSIGYKLNDKSIVGIGSSYKLGWGKDIRHISITHQGAGIRSFADYKMKGNFWLTGGAEFNYRSQFDSFEVLNDYSAWQKSALLGLRKKYQVNKKFKGSMQLMYDFLWKQQVPRTQAVLFRIGYTLK